MKELHNQADRLRRDNDQLQAQIEKSRDPKKDSWESGRDAQLIACNKKKGPIPLDDKDTLVDDELSSGSSLSLNLSSTMNAWENTRTKSCKRPLPHPAFSDAVSGASRRSRREVGRR